MTATVQLPLDHYCKGEPFMLEKTALFTNAWLPVCARAQLVGNGAYLGHVIAGWPIVAVRDADALRVFRNTCRHQNMMVLDQATGQCDVVQCRYHGWRYRLDGIFLSAPPLVAPADPLDPSNNLAPLCTTMLAGLVLGHLGTNPATFEPEIEVAALCGAAADDLILAGSFVTELACNWKIVIEHALASGAVFQWPLLLMRPHVKGIQVAQIVPRSFVRTRVVSYLLTRGAPDANSADAIDEIKAHATRIKEACQVRQKQVELGEYDIPSDERVSRFRQRVLESVSG